MSSGLAFQVLGEEAVDGGLEVCEGAEQATLEPPPGAGQSRRESDEAVISRGGDVFDRQGCAECHTPPTYTSPGSYDVGLTDEAGRSKFNPPSLRGVGQRNSYFHDGRAGSLEEVFSKCRHRIEEDLSEGEVRDLLAFLRSL